MYSTIYVPVDNSPLSEGCATVALSLARPLGARIVGSHVYAARMHERRFRQMEAALPEEYLDDREVERQRAIHDSLIALGLQLISDCYLDALERRCQEQEVPFERKTFEGKNWERLVEDVTVSSYDLVVLGARGHGTTRQDTLGSVCLRVLRRVRRDVLIVKEPDAFAGQDGRPVVVALDGSAESFGALRAALALGKACGWPVEAVAAYDPYFHYAVFQSLVEVLSTEAARLFRFREQERLHEEIIDMGLARLYQTYLEIASQVAALEGVPLATRLLTGRAADEVLAYAETRRPRLVLLGRVGAHGAPGLDLGSVTEHITRLSPCNVLVASQRFTPDLALWENVSVRWTEEAQDLLGQAPAEHRGALRILVQQRARERGHSVVTAALVGEALASLRPERAYRVRIEEAALSVAVEALQRAGETTYVCQQCGHLARAGRPGACPVCRAPGEIFLELDTGALQGMAPRPESLAEREAFDGERLRWTPAALEALRQIPDRYERDRGRLRVEKEARRLGARVITPEIALRVLRVPGPPRPLGGQDDGHSR